MKCYNYIICFPMSTMGMVQNSDHYVDYSNYDFSYRLL
jgi:hypothetical protein